MENEIYLTEFKINEPRDRDQLNISKNKTQDYPKFKEIIKHKQNYGFQIMCEEYYANKKVKPGILIYKTIIQIQQQRQKATVNKFPNLHLLIPQTLVFHDNTYKLISVANGKITIKSNPNLKDFLNNKIQLKQGQTLQPAFHSKIYNGIEVNNTITLSCDISTKLIPNTDNQIVSKYIFPFGGAANLLRLFFHPKRSATTRKNSGLKFTNNVVLNDDILSKKHKLVSNCLVNSQKDNTYTTAIIYGKALEKYQEMAQSLTEYLQTAHKIKILEMVVDFTIDQHKNSYFHQLKSVKSVQLTNIWDKANEETLQHLIKQKMNENQCPICQIYYSKGQMQRIVTAKLIQQLLVHLEMRGIQLQDYGLKKIKADNKLVHVCQLCYDIILAQHKLINCSTNFSKILNIKPESIYRVPHLKPQKLSSQFSKQKQWRLFLFIENIRNVKIETSQILYQLQTQFNNIKHKYTGQSKVNNLKDQSSVLQYRPNSESRYNYSSLISKSIKPTIKRNKLKLTHLDKNSTNCSFDNNISILSRNTFKANKILNQSQTTYQTSPTELDSIRKNCVEAIFDKANKSILRINQLKLYQLYTEISPNHEQKIKKFLAPATLKIKLYLQGKVYSGNSQILTNISCKPNQCSRISTEVHLFDQKYQHISLQLTVGIICDGQRCVYDKDLIIYDDIKLGNQHLKTCDPLPQQWMQIWSNNTQSQQISSQNNRNIKQIKGKNTISNNKLKKNLIKNF